jgi:hypothetical protein
VDRSRVRLSALSPREASIFACLVDALVAPRSPLAPVTETNAVAAFDSWLAASPRPNRLGLRALLYTVELGPLLTGRLARMRTLDRAGRTHYLEAIDNAPLAAIRQVGKLVKSMAYGSYYGDDAILRTVGYDPDARVDRGRRLRAEEGRP